MYRLSLIISEIYNKYLPLAEKDGIVLNLDFSDTTKEIADPKKVKQFLDENLDSTLKRSDKGEVTIGVDKDSITITDSATILSRAACSLLSNRYIDVSSRVGFGTTVRIFLKPREEIKELPDANAPKTSELTIEGASGSITIDKTPTPSIQSEVKLSAKQNNKSINLGAKLKLNGKKKSSSKPKSMAKTNFLAKSAKTKEKKASNKTVQKTKRELASAAKKADKEVKRIAKKAEKQTKKAQKSTKTASNAKKTVRKLKLS